MKMNNSTRTRWTLRDEIRFWRKYNGSEGYPKYSWVPEMLPWMLAAWFVFFGIFCIALFSDSEGCATETITIKGYYDKDLNDQCPTGVVIIPSIQNGDIQVETNQTQQELQQEAIKFQEETNQTQQELQQEATRMQEEMNKLQQQLQKEINRAFGYTR